MMMMMVMMMLRGDESSTCVCLRLREQHLRSEIKSNQNQVYLVTHT